MTCYYVRDRAGDVAGIFVEAPEGPVECVRVYGAGLERACGHTHKSRPSAMKCARSLARGDGGGHGVGHVETRSTSKAP